MPEIKILHLSDLHFDSSDYRDTGIVLDALWEDLDNFEGIDFILFSGDLVKAGDKKEDFEKAFEKFIKPLLEKTNLGKDYFFLAPGNHDIQRKAIDKVIEKGLKKELTDRESLNSFLDDEMKEGFKHIERLDHFNNFKTRFGKRHVVKSNQLFSTYMLNKENTKIGIACLNSSWRATGIGEAHDYGKLLMGERQVDTALDNLKSCEIKIAVYHHPLDWLMAYDKEDSITRLSKGFDFLFCGHLHNANLALVQNFMNKSVLIRGGSLYKGRKFFNGYSVFSIDVEKGEGIIYLRSYFDELRNFNKAVNKHPDGEVKINIKIKYDGDDEGDGITKRKSKKGEKIKEKVNDKLSIQNGPDEPTPGPPTPKRKFFKTSMSQIESSFIDLKNQLWVTDGQQVKIFHVNNTDSIDGWPLMGKRWKKIFHQPWFNSLLCADWEGSLYIFNEKTRGEGQVLRKARYNDLPVHCITGEEMGQVGVGTWDGKILIYDSGEGANRDPHIMTIPYLPIHLDILAPGSIAAADQSGCVRLIDSHGAQKVIWKGDASIKDMWAYEEKSGHFVLLILEKNSLVEVKIPGSKSQVIPLDGEVISLSHRKRNAQDKWTAVVMKGGIIDWLSWKPLRILNNNRVKFNFEVRQFIALYDPQQPTALIGIGLTGEGKFFSLNGRDLKMYDSPSIERLLVDNGGRFVFWLFKDSIEWQRNPVLLPTYCKVEKISTDGCLIAGKYKEIRVTLKNSGPVPIFKMKTQLKGQKRIIEERAEERKIQLFPDQTIDLSFSVKAIAVGTLELELQMQMEDEAGPPACKQAIGLRVESKEK